jgi:predicted RNase H-like HicB family nuclease
MTRYAIVIERAEHNYAAYAPDVPGCVATGATPSEVKAQMREALEFHLEALAETGEPIPQPASSVDYVEVRPPATIAGHEAAVGRT